MENFLNWLWENAQTLEALAALLLVPLLWLLRKIFTKKKNESQPAPSGNTTTFEGDVQVGGDFVMGDSIKNGDKNA